jgi:hypothetical protein
MACALQTAIGIENHFSYENPKLHRGIKPLSVAINLVTIGAVKNNYKVDYP